jgi:hypothetical protein
LLGKPLPDWVSITICELGDTGRLPVYRVLLNAKTVDECAIFVAQKIVQKCSEFARGGRVVTGVVAADAKLTQGRRLKTDPPRRGVLRSGGPHAGAEEAVEIRVLRRQGKSIREIARMLEVSRNTARRYLRDEGLPRYEREARPSKLDPYKR